MMLAAPVAAQTSQNLEWGIEAPQMTYFHLNYEGDPYPIDEDMYGNITGPLAAIPDPLTNFSDIPDTLVDLKYLNGTDLGMYIMWFLFTLKMAVPTGNWSLMTDLVESVTGIDILGTVFPIQPEVTIDDWLHWGFSYNYTQMGYDNVIHVTYLKSDGYLASMSVVGYDLDKTTIIGTIDLDRDGTAPVITSPADISYNVSDTGNEITWSATDQSPAGYIVYKDNVEVERGMWTSSSQSIVVDVDGLAAGLYEYEIEFYEASGISASDVVTVNVTAGATTSDTGTGTGTSDFISENLMLIIGVGGAAVIIIVIVIIIKKK